MLRNLFSNHPFASRVILGIFLFFIAIVLTGIIEGLTGYKKVFPFTGMILLLLATWILYKTEGQNLDELGLKLSYNHTLFFLLGLFISVGAFFIATLLKNLVTGQEVHFNDLFDYKPAITIIYYLFPMVVVEELLYRGYLFKKVINKTSIIIANLIFSIIFMLVHVLDIQVLSSLGAIILMAITIPVGHILFATALLKSNTLLFPIGLHLGNNWATRHLLSSNQNQEALFYITGSGTFETWPSFISYIVIWNGFYLLLAYFIWKWPESKK